MIPYTRNGIECTRPGTPEQIALFGGLAAAIDKRQQALDAAVKITLGPALYWGELRRHMAAYYYQDEIRAAFHRIIAERDVTQPDG